MEAGVLSSVNAAKQTFPFNVRPPPPPLLPLGVVCAPSSLLLTMPPLAHASSACLAHPPHTRIRMSHMRPDPRLILAGSKDKHKPAQTSRSCMPFAIGPWERSEDQFAMRSLPHQPLLQGNDWDLIQYHARLFTILKAAAFCHHQDTIRTHATSWLVSNDPRRLPLFPFTGPACLALQH